MSTVKVIIVEHPVDLRWLRTSRQNVYIQSYYSRASRRLAMVEDFETGCLQSKLL